MTDYQSEVEVCCNINMLNYESQRCDECADYRHLLACQLKRLETVEKNPGPKTNREPITTQTPQEQARRVVEILVEFLTLFGFDASGFSTAGDVRSWTEWITSCGDWMKVTKYKIAAFYANAQRHLLEDQTLPPPPCPGLGHPFHLLGGRAGRFIRREIRRDGPHRDEFLCSLLYVKTGMPRPDTTALEKAAIATIGALTTTRKEDYGRRDKLRASVTGSALHREMSQVLLEEEVRRTVREAFRTAPDGSHLVLRFKTRDLLSNPLTPSSSANFYRSRSGHGTLGELTSRNFFGQKVRPPLVAERRHDEESLRNSDAETYELSGYRGMRDQFLHTYFSALRESMRELPIAEAVPLAEALKVRVITKGPPLTQFCLQPLQKFMWKHLSSLPCFELTGKPIEVASLRKRLGDLTDDEAWLSGDYSDATNQMDPRMSNVAWEEMCKVCCVPEALKQLGFRVLTGHLVVTDRDTIKKFSKLDSAMPQQWGQLMGSIISFPILCLVNAAICRAAIEHDSGRKVSLRDAPLMVNGDDCLLKVGPAGYAAWSTFGKMVGLKPSLGKVYYSKHFCNMNSTTFRYRHSDEPDAHITFERIRLIRLGLVFGLKRSEGPGDLAPLNRLIEEVFGDPSTSQWDGTVGARHRALLSECPERCVSRVHLKFLSKNAEALSFCTDRAIPWYVPTCYGGAGLQPLPHLGYDVSDKDKSIITAMLHPAAWSSDPANVPMPRKIGSPQETQIHLIGMKAVSKLLGANLKRRWVDEGTSPQVVEPTLIDSWAIYQRWEEVFTNLGEDGGLSVTKAQLNQNRKTWNWYLKHMKEFAWMGHSTIVPRKLVYDVHLTERHESVLPTREDIALSEIDELLYSHKADGTEEESADSARAFAESRYLDMFFRRDWDPVSQTMRGTSF